MAQPQYTGKEADRQSKFWMRAISFAGLHRILKAVSDFPTGLRAGEINKLVQENNILHTRSGSPLAPTTLYHYRNTLLQLDALKRDGRLMRVNKDNPDVCELLSQPAPDNRGRLLCDVTRGPFAALVMNNEQCRSLFFDLFMPTGASTYTVSNFQETGAPVTWKRENSSRGRKVIFQNTTTGRKSYCSTHSAVAAILYGVRYWARDELRLIDEYCIGSDGGTVMFPVLLHDTHESVVNSAKQQVVRFILSQRTASEWTLFSILDLIIHCCEARRQSISVLFSAIDWLLQEWPNHTFLIPTSRAMATLTATSPHRDALELRRYYKTSDGPYISHIRIHKDIAIKPTEATNDHTRYTATTPTRF